MGQVTCHELPNLFEPLMMYGPFLRSSLKARLRLKNYFEGSPPLYASFTVLQLYDFL